MYTLTVLEGDGILNESPGADVKEKDGVIMKFKGIITEKKPLAKAAALLLAVLMLVYGAIMKGEYVYVPVALLIIMACFMKKEQIVSEDGVDIAYNTFGKLTHNIWTWDEITAIHTERKKAKPNIRVGFAKGTDARAFLMTPEDYEGVLELVKRMNPHVKIVDDK